MGGRTWKLLAGRGLVPQDGSIRDNAVALATLLALANVYRDFCQAAFDEPSDITDVAYAAEDVSPLVSEAALARLAGEMDVDDGEEDYDSLTGMVAGLVRWRRPDVVAALLRGTEPLQLLRELSVTCLTPDVFIDEDGEPLPDSGREAILAEPWNVGTGSSMAAYAWVAGGCSPLSA